MHVMRKYNAKPQGICTFFYYILYSSEGTIIFYGYINQKNIE